MSWQVQVTILGAAVCALLAVVLQGAGRWTLIGVAAFLTGWAIYLMVTRPTENKNASVQAVAAQPSPLPPINLTNIQYAPQTQATTQSQTQSHKQKIEQPKPRVPRFNFCCSEIFPICLLEEKNGYSIINQPQYWRGFGTKQPALVMEITNRPAKEFTPDYASDVIAELIIDGATHISPLVWLDNNHGEIAFSSGHPNTLLLTVADSGYSDHWVIPRYLPRTTEHGWRPINTDFSVPNGLEPDIRIELSIGGRVIKEIPLAWKWPNGKLHVEVKQDNQQ